MPRELSIKRRAIHTHTHTHRHTHTQTQMQMCVCGLSATMAVHHRPEGKHRSGGAGAVLPVAYSVGSMGHAGSPRAQGQACTQVLLHLL